MKNEIIKLKIEKKDIVEINNELDSDFFKSLNEVFDNDYYFPHLNCVYIHFYNFDCFLNIYYSYY